VADRLRQQGADVHTHVVIAEEPVSSILHEAQLRQAGLIALESHGRRGLSRLLHGSIADKIVRAGSIPVLLNRPRR
jgi:nucleotide-binding universal stress UspA family protein